MNSKIENSDENEIWAKDMDLENNNQVEDSENIINNIGEDIIVDDGINKIVDNDEDNTSNENNNIKGVKWKKVGKIFVSILLGLFIIITSGYFYIRSKIYTGDDLSNKVEIVTTTNDSENSQTPKTDFKEVHGITNILLIGADGRGENDTPKSDSIIIATLDNNNKKIKLTSLYRDTLVNIPGYGQQRINASYELGGTKLLIETIKQTYDIKIDKYLTIDFKGFEAIIDQIGGIEVDVKDYQLTELNKYIGESTGGNDCPVTKTGIQTLNGKQALSYSRIRKGVGDDYARTERQREVLFQVAEKLKTTNPTKYFGIMKSMLNYIDMNFEPIEALNMAYTIYKFPTLVTEQMSIPVQDITVDKKIAGLGDVLVMDKFENTRILHGFIFEDKQNNEVKQSDN
ncbi:MAG: LCP family protein [Clostridium sp.]